MIGDFYGGSQMNFRADSVIDRVAVFADDLDAPGVLPPGGSLLTITEPGPVGIFDTSLASVQQLQALFRAGSPIPGATLLDTINQNATLTTQQTIAQIQTQLASTALPYDIISLQQPPGTYATAVDGLFQTHNGIRGTTIYDANASGALIQGGVDTLNGGEDLDAFYFYHYVVRFNNALADATSGGVGRLKIAEGGSVLPTDRLFFRYSNIHNASYTNQGSNLNRFVPGFEKTFLDRLISFELRAPFVTDATTSYSLDGDAFTNGNSTRFGNLSMYAKAMLIQYEKLAVTGGMGITLPTASNVRVNYLDGTELLRIKNQSVHLQPFLGMLYTPNTRLFAHGFLQFDAVASGNDVAINSGAGLSNVGTLTDSSSLFVDAGLGYWLYRTNKNRGVTGIVPTVEIHQTSSVQEGDAVTSGPFQVGNFGGNTSIISFVAGTTVEFGRRSQLTAGYSTPIGGGTNRQYDGAFQLFYSRNFGQ